MATKKPVKAAKPVAKISKSVKPVLKTESKSVKSVNPQKMGKPAKSVKIKKAIVVKGKITSTKKTIAPTKVITPKKPVIVKKSVVKNKQIVVAKKPLAIKKVELKNSKNIKIVVAAKKTSLSTKANSKVATKEVIKKIDVKPNPKKLKEPVKKTAIIVKKVSKPVVQIKQPAVPAKAEKIVKPIEKEVKAHITPILISKPSVDKAPKIATKKVSEKPMKPVVIPKTSTTNKVDYEPDFLKSVLDAAEPEPQGPTMRYNDNELNEFRELINKKLDSAKKELAYLQGLITRRDEMGGDETDNRYVTMEDGGMSMEREQLSQMASRQITFIDHLEKAIMRIENKTYGICRVSGKLIDKARLRAVPHATLSMEAKLGIVSK